MGVEGNAVFCCWGSKKEPAAGTGEETGAKTGAEGTGVAVGGCTAGIAGKGEETDLGICARGGAAFAFFAISQTSTTNF